MACVHLKGVLFDLSLGGSLTWGELTPEHNCSGESHLWPEPSQQWWTHHKGSPGPLVKRRSRRLRFRDIYIYIYMSRLYDISRVYKDYGHDIQQVHIDKNWYTGQFLKQQVNGREILPPAVSNFWVDGCSFACAQSAASGRADCEVKPFSRKGTHTCWVCYAPSMNHVQNLCNPNQSKLYSVNL